MDVRTKSFWLSKTWWVSAALASACEFNARLNQWVAVHPHTVLLGTIVLYLLLRNFTSSALHYGVKR